MLKRLSQRERVPLLIAEFEPIIRQAFFESIADIRSKITLRLLIERLERRDIAGAIDVLHIEREAFTQFETAIARAYEGGGISMAEQLMLRDPQGHRIVFRFGVRNPEAEAWLREHSATAVTQIVEGQLQGIRLALSEGMAEGMNPRSTALSIVGRVNRATGRREGGLIGLTAQQTAFVTNARRELRSGNAEAMRNYLNRERRDRRFDAAVQKAIREGRALPADMVERVVGRYSERLLALRGEMLARTETMFALGRSRNDAIRQAIAQGKVDAAFVTKHWRSAGDNRVRHTHQALNGTSVSFYEAFQSPSGARLRFPGDPEAPLRETSGCRCTVEYRVDYLGRLVERRAS